MALARIAEVEHRGMEDEARNPDAQVAINLEAPGVHRTEDLDGGNQGGEEQSMNTREAAETRTLDQAAADGKTAAQMLRHRLSTPHAARSSPRSRF